MSAPPTSERYSSASIILHWLMLALMVAAYAAIELREFYPRGTDTREALKSWHYTIGLSVFVLVWLRSPLAWSGQLPRPSRTDGVTPCRWRRTARSMC